jgi:hypothetical protein
MDMSRKLRTAIRASFHLWQAHSIAAPINFEKFPEMRNTFPDLVKTPGWLGTKQGAECVLFQAD